LMYKWTAKHTNQEAALIALALFAISPTLVQQIDSFGAGIFLLICFVFGNWLDHAYRSKPRMFGGWYFTQMIMIAVAITLHPIALAYPLALAYMWWKKPDPTKNSLHVYIGILLSVVVAMAIKAGWDNIHWLQNPVIGLADAIQGHVLMSTADVNWAFGVIFLALLAAVVIVDNKFIFSDLLGFILLLAIVIGFLVGDSSWALLCLALVLFRGIPLLIQLNSSLGKTGLLGQRGVVIGLVFLLATTFMIQDKAQSIDHRLQMISPEDQLIATLASVASDDNLPFRAASEWPGRTMLAAKRDVLGLPPRFEDQSQYREALKGLTHVLFNPYEEKNKTLSEFLSQNGDVAETLLLEPMGVIMAIREHNVRITERRVQQAGQEESEQNTAKHKPAHANELDTQ
ncbi:MAG: hypothetical protein OEX00_08270, partial [Gammaproteobacteria bacterium]|nr:hypothetical protein [Gammaproteobacteria bacterium]